MAARFRARRNGYGTAVSGAAGLEGTTPQAWELGEIVYLSGASTVAPDTILEL